MRHLQPTAVDATMSEKYNSRFPRRNAHWQLRNPMVYHASLACGVPLLSGVGGKISKISHTGGKCETCRELHILEKDNSEVNRYCVSPCLSSTIHLPFAVSI